jgi:glycerate kinase
MGALEAALAHLARRVAEATGADVSSTPGVGAAGGLAFGLAALFGGRLLSGFELVADVSGLEARLDGADWVLTGEGRLDAQSLLGKGPVALAGRARARGCRVAAFVGQSATDAAGVFDAVIEAPAGTPLTPERAARALERAVGAWALDMTG